jgi:hypothetical protein
VRLLQTQASTCDRSDGRDHEAGDDAVEGGALEVQRFAQLADALLARAQRSEVGHRARHHLHA